MMLLVQCPSCKQLMKYQQQGKDLGRKKCVFCGKSFSVNRETIIKKTTPTEGIKPLFVKGSRRL